MRGISRMAKEYARNSAYSFRLYFPEDLFEDFSDEETGRFFKALMHSIITNTEPEFEDRDMRIIWHLLKSYLTIYRSDE